MTVPDPVRVLEPGQIRPRRSRAGHLIPAQRTAPGRHRKWFRHRLGYYQHADPGNVAAQRAQIWIADRPHRHHVGIRADQPTARAGGRGCRSRRAIAVVRARRQWGARRADRLPATRRETRRRAGPARDDRRAAGDPCGAGRGVGRRCGQRGPSGPRPRRQGSRQPRLLDRGVSRPGRGAVRERAAGPEPAASRPSGTDSPAGPGRRWLPASAASVSIVRVSDSLRACGPARY